MDYRQTQSYRYHVLTKHSLESLYSSNHSLDWQTQPNPFRVYEGSKKILLPREIPLDNIGLFEAVKKLIAGFSIEKSDNPMPPPAVPGDLNFLSALLYYSMAISAWKEIKGSPARWSLRVNPSSGNLHPTETHILVCNIDGIEDGAYHYCARDHSLELRSNDPILRNVWNEYGDQNEEAPSVMLVLNSIFWREAWKYRDRAFRYCQLDMGHAVLAVSLSAASFGWRAKLISEFADKELAEILGLAESDEKPMLLIPLYPVSSEKPEINVSAGQEKSAGQRVFIGHPNKLSSSQVDYQSIDVVYQATCLDKGEFHKRKNEMPSVETSRVLLEDEGMSLNLSQTYFQPKSDPNVFAVIRKRRSAVDMDGKLRISLARLSRILIDSSRGANASYLQTLCWESSSLVRAYFIHLLVFIHKVDGIAPGIYIFDRNTLELKSLKEDNVSRFAKFVSCLQDIASDGVFAVSMIADFESAFKKFGERAYRYVHQEAGMIGHLFYLSARALGIDATGIGCFLDDEINQSMPSGMEAVYNFTFGKAVLDCRLSDLPAYDFADPTSHLWSELP